MSGNENDEVAEQFNLQDWCKAAGLTRKTEGTLSKEELTSLDALKMLEPVDLREMGLPIGQRKLLQQAVASLRTDQDRVPGGVRNDIRAGVPETDEAGGASMRDHGDQEANAGLLAASSSGITIEDIRRQAAALGSAGKTFDELFSPPPHTAQVSHNPTPMVATAAASMPPLSAPPQPQLPGISHSDPRTILTIKSGSQKVVHITQFLAESTKKRLRSNRRGIVLGAGGENVLIHTEDEHPYNGISISEWGAANSRLMAHLLQTGALTRDHIEFYLAYTTQIFEYAAIYDWGAVLDWDFTYRERQATYGFMWGHIPPNMHMSLVSRPRQPYQRYKPMSSKSAPPKPQQHGPPSRYQNNDGECRLFKAHNGDCPFGDRCKFTHTLATGRNDAKNANQPGPQL